MKYKPVRKKLPSEISAKHLDAALRGLVGVLFVSLPFVMSLTGWEKFRVPKDSYAAIFILLIGTLFLVSRRLYVRFRPNSWEFFLGIGLIYVAVHSLLSKCPKVSLSGFAWISYFAALLLLLTEIASEPLQKKLWMWMAAASAVNAVLAIFQYFGWFPFMARPSGEVLQGRLTPGGLIGDVNSGGFLFGLACLILLYGVFAEKNRKQRSVATVLFFLNLAGLAFARTLTSILALVCCLGLWLVFHHWWLFRHSGQMTRQLLLFWIVILVGAIGAVGVAVKSGVTARMQLVLSQIRQGDWALVTSGRQPVYLITWEMIQERFWLGHGLNTFGQDFFFYRVGTPLGQSVTIIDQPGRFGEVHNEFLQAWEELGFFGLFFLLGFLFWPIAKSVPLFFRTRDSEKFYWIGILTIGLLFVALSSLSYFPFHVSLTAAWSVLLVACLRHFQNQERTPFDDSWLRMLGKAIVFSVLAAGLAYPQIERWKANNEVGVAASLLREAASDDLDMEQKQLLASAAEQRLKQAEKLYPQLYEIYYYRGYASLLLRKYEEAERYYRTAAAYLPSAEVFTDLAVTQMAQGRLDQARPLLEMALRYNPAFRRGQEALAYLKANTR